MTPKRNTLAYRESYRRRLPHIQPITANLFVTFRLADSLPVAYIRKLREQAERERLALKKNSDSVPNEELELRLDAQYRKEFGRWDRALDQVLCGPTWLQVPEVAGLVVNSLHRHHGERYELDAFCVMPNHVHVLMRPLEKADGEVHSLASIMHSIKGFTAVKCNNVLRRRGQFWQHESYDHVVRDEAEWERVVNYTLLNPVKAGLVRDADEWAYSYYAGRR